MKFEKRILTILTISMLFLSTFVALSGNLIPKASASDGNGAELTGNIVDSGKDTDGDAKFDYLEVAIQINVSSEGYYSIEIPYIVNPQNNSYYYPVSKYDYLSLGLRWLNVSFYGPKIYIDKFNVSALGEIRLYKQYGILIDDILYVPLSKVYYYTDFDCRAFLTGKIYDEGVDTDSDGLFNSLQVGVEINVTEPATYEVYSSGLYGTNAPSIYVYNYSRSFLNTGINIVNVSLNGAKIYVSHANNISRVSSIALSVMEENYQLYTLEYRYNQLLNKNYSYIEFDTLAFFTGKILDEGVDEDDNGLYDYLKISVEVNVTDAGHYRIEFNYLVGNYSDYIYESQSFEKEFEAGIHLINLTVNGPKIYSVHINPVYVETLQLNYISSQMEWIKLDDRHMVQLPMLYNYSEFESHAFLTGKVYDKPFDTDADGLWDYLEVGVEVNVTEAGTYEISVDGLADEHKLIYYYPPSFIGNFDIGIHVVNFTFPGSMLPYYHFNPTNVTYLYLIEMPNFVQLDFIQSTALSKRYNYTQFNAPLNDMQLEFTVYPDASIGVNGLINYTHAFIPYYSQPMANASIEFSTNGNFTTGSANGTIVLPEEFYLNPYYFNSHEFPLNSTIINFASQYNNGILNANLGATVDLPPEGHTTYPFNSSNLSLHGAYSNGMVNINLHGETTLPSFIASMFPLNITDVTAMADYDGNKLKGNITFHAISGFPLGDVIVNFSGNQTEVTFTGYADVTYGNWFGMELNQTTLEEMLYAYNSTIPGHGASSLYDMTMGMVECTTLNTTMTPFANPLVGATVNYTATIRGNFTQLLAYEIAGPSGTDETRSLIDAAINATLSSIDHASLLFRYYYGSKIGFLNLTLTSDVKALWSNALQLIPSKVPLEYRNQTGALLKVANITAYAVENANLDVDYSSDTQLLTIHASLTANVSKMKDEIIPILPETVPPQFKDFVKLCTNTTYCTLESLNTTCNYANGVVDFDAKWLLDGNFTKELNRIKSCYIQYLNLTSPWMINWQMEMLNATEIDLSNFKAEIRQSEIMLDEYWITFQFEGVKLRLVKDEIDPIRFQLYRLFNLTSNPYESPREFEKLKITIIGASDSDHTVLLYTPPAIPSPDDSSLDYKTMIWQNSSLSSLRDISFRIAYQQVIPYLGNNYNVPIFTNSTISNFKYDFSNTNKPNISFKVSGTTGKGFCNITIPRALMDVAMGNWTVRINGTTLLPSQFSFTQNAEYAFIYLNYTYSDHTIEIEGTWVVKEFPTDMFLPILMMLSIIATIIAVKQRKKLGKVKVKYQNAISTFAKQRSQLRT
jgi:hypothetical protein